MFSAILLFRVNTFWRIVGCVHSQHEYLQNGIHARPTPTDNPVLSKKISFLYDLLTEKYQINNVTAQIQTEPIKPNNNAAALKTSLSISSNIEHSLQNYQNRTKIAINQSNPISFEIQSLQNVPESNEKVEEKKDSANKPTFRSNISMKTLPEDVVNLIFLRIPIYEDQRWLMLSLEDDFTHIWFQTWRKFLSLRRILNALEYARKVDKTIEISPANFQPLVFVTSQYHHQIFIGPYKLDESKNIALFHRHENHMLLVENYIKQYGAVYEKRTTGKWIFYFMKIVCYGSMY